jgi:osmoprotectant transport system ATP-binding protein
VIRFEGVTKRFPDGTVAVGGLDLVAPSHKITVLVGPSGCGKTTSLRMVNRMIVPSEGRISIDDVDTASMDAAELRRGIGYVIQHAGLFPHRTVADNVATVPRLIGWDRRKARSRSLELLERVGLPPDFADRYPHQLSGGQQQRVGVARALAADPPVMLMDEPFSAVDPVVREQLQDEFLRLQAELGKTILFVTHDIDEAVKLGDQVAVLRVGGTAAQVAEPATLLADPADDFVADFVGRDRGYRGLTFRQAPRLTPEEEPCVHLGEGVPASSTAEWLLVVDTERRPLGWIEPHRLGTDLGDGKGTGTVSRDHLHRGGTVARLDGSARSVLDAALSSPSGRGVVVDDDGVLLGTVTAQAVVTAISAHPGSSEAGARARSSSDGAG